MENEFLGFETNFDTVVSADHNDVTQPINTDESPSSVTTAGDEPEVEIKEVEQQQPISQNKEPDKIEDVKPDAPKMIPYNEQSLLKELASSIKEESGIEISDITELKSFISSFRDKIIDTEFSKNDSQVLRKAKELILEEKGIDDHVLAIATGIPYGIDRNEYMEYVTVSEFADQDIDPKDFESLKTLYATYHSVKGIAEEDIESYVEADINMNDESMIEKRKSFLKDYADKGLSSIKDKIDNMHKKKVDFDTLRKKQINESISALVKDNEFTKEEIDKYIAGTTAKTEKITLPDGTEKMVTPFEKKKYLFSQENLKDAIRDNILFFLDKKDTKKIIAEDKDKAKEAGSLLNNYMKDIKSSSEMIHESKDEDNGFSIVKSQL